jgi:hypothetical protein
MSACELRVLLSNGINLCYESSNLEDMKRSLSLTSAVLNRVDCSSAPDCESLNRLSCSSMMMSVEGTCGPYLGLGDTAMKSQCMSRAYSRITSGNIRPAIGMPVWVRGFVGVRRTLFVCHRVRGVVVFISPHLLCSVVSLMLIVPRRACFSSAICSPTSVNPLSNRVPTLARVMVAVCSCRTMRR